MTMKNTLKLNHENHTIVMDRWFAKYAENTRSDEYAHLQRVRQDYPTYEVIRRKIMRNAEMEQYMEEYIMTHGTADEIKANLNKYEELRLIAECHSKARRYPAIKSWFLEMYPEIVKFGNKEEKPKILQIGEKRAS